MEKNKLYEHIIDEFIDICEENGEKFTDILNYFKDNIKDKYKDFNNKTYYYKLVDDYYEDNEDDIILCTDKDAKELLEIAIDYVWHNRDFIDDLPEEITYNEEDDEITYNGKQYSFPRNYGELLGFIFDLLEDNGIKCWRPTFQADETFYY